MKNTKTPGHKRGEPVTINRPNAKRKIGAIACKVPAGERPNLDKYPLRAYHKLREVVKVYKPASVRLSCVEKQYVLPKPRDHTSYVVKLADGTYAYPPVKYLCKVGGK